MFNLQAFRPVIRDHLDVEMAKGSVGNIEGSDHDDPCRRRLPLSRGNPRCVPVSDRCRNRLDRARMGRRARAQAVRRRRLRRSRTQPPPQPIPWEALEYTTPEEVPDGTTLWRAFDAVDPTELQDCHQTICAELLADEKHGWMYAIVDGTHNEPWANTRQEIEAVEGASWGKRGVVLRLQGLPRDGLGDRVAGYDLHGHRQTE